MSQLLMLVLLSFAIPDTSRVFGKVYHIQRSAEYATPSRIALPGYAPLESDDVSGYYRFGEGSRRRYKRADNDKLIVNMTVLPDEGHNEAIVHWSGKTSLVCF